VEVEKTMETQRVMTSQSISASCVTRLDTSIRIVLSHGTMTTQRKLVVALEDFEDAGILMVSCWGDEEGEVVHLENDDTCKLTFM